MKIINKLLLIILIFASCGNPSRQNSNAYEDHTSSESYGYEDGEYCAEIKYYYSKSGTNSEYTLKVEIEDNELIKIFWSNGGWLDDSHFDPVEISDGSASFESDKGVEYEVEIIGSEEDCNLSWNSPSEMSFIRQAENEICPKCGEAKDSYDSYCDDCTDEIENTCSRCGGYEYYVYGGLCSSCQEEDEEEEEDEDW